MASKDWRTDTNDTYPSLEWWWAFPEEYKNVAVLPITDFKMALKARLFYKLDSIGIFDSRV